MVITLPFTFASAKSLIPFCRFRKGLFLASLKKQNFLEQILAKLKFEEDFAFSTPFLKKLENYFLALLKNKQNLKKSKASAKSLIPFCRFWLRQNFLEQILASLKFEEDFAFSNF